MLFRVVLFRIDCASSYSSYDKRCSDISCFICSGKKIRRADGAIYPPFHVTRFVDSGSQDVGTIVQSDQDNNMRVKSEPDESSEMHMSNFISSISGDPLRSLVPYDLADSRLDGLDITFLI